MPSPPGAGEARGHAGQAQGVTPRAASSRTPGEGGLEPGPGDGGPAPAARLPGAQGSPPGSGADPSGGTVSPRAGAHPGDDVARHREVRRVTLIGAALDLVLGVVKVVTGVVAQSQALIADGIHSFSDLATDFVVIFASREAHRAPDEEHPYGHARVETVATVVLGAALLAVGTGIAFDAARRLFSPEELWRPGIEALVVAAISVVSKELIYHYTMRSARRLRSDMLRANAWHSRTDALSSVFVVLGVAGSLAGLEYIDAIAAIAVAVLIMRIGWDLGWSSLRELIDTGLESARLEAIRQAIMSVPGVEALHMLRTRRMAGKAFVDVHIIVSNPRLSVSEGHQISETVRARLIDTIDEVADVTVHIDPEDDELEPRTHHLPTRAELLERLRERWRDIPEARHIRDLTLHYLSGGLHLDVFLPLPEARSDEELRALEARFRDALAADPDIAEVRLRFSPPSGAEGSSGQDGGG